MLRGSASGLSNSYVMQFRSKCNLPTTRTSAFLNRAFCNTSSQKERKLLWLSSHKDSWNQRVVRTVKYSGRRNSSWASRLNSRFPEPFGSVSDGHDEAARRAILERVMQSRQPADLMLRCEPFFCSSPISNWYRVTNRHDLGCWRYARTHCEDKKAAE